MDLSRKKFVSTSFTSSSDTIKFEIVYQNLLIQVPLQLKYFFATTCKKVLDIKDNDEVFIPSLIMCKLTFYCGAIHYIDIELENFSRCKN